MCVILFIAYTRQNAHLFPMQNPRSMILLGVNVDHCATLRQARYQGYPRTRGEMVEPDPVAFALAAEQAGADGITVHPREDHRHIQPDDVLALRQSLQVPLNMEMAATPEMTGFALKVAPQIVCIVPERREEVTTEGGLDVPANSDALRHTIDTVHSAGILVSLFIDPDFAQIDAAALLQADFVELHTGSFANEWFDLKKRQIEINKLANTAAHARQCGLKVNLGHGINYTNIRDVRDIEGIHEMNIGHAIVSRALFTGIREAVREMKLRMNPGFST